VTRRLRPSSEWTRFTVLLIADPPAERSDPATDGPAGRHEALVALARAVFAAGGRIALPADPGVTLVLATVGLEYAAARPAERREETGPPPVLVVETGPAHQRPRNLLAPLVARGVVEYRDGDGEVVPASELAIPGPDAIGLTLRGRDPISPSFVENTQPDRAVLLSSGRATLQDAEVLRGFGVPMVALQDTMQDPQTREDLSWIEDPSERLLSGRRRNRWAHDDEDADRPPPMPYAYVMQRLVAEWFGRGLPPAGTAAPLSIS
jgi:hypothetical protein